jgi:hypothetical protein
MAIPTLSKEQLSAARAAATEARRHRAELKSKVRSGELTLGGALDVCENDDVLAHIRVSDLLKSVPRVGDKRAADIMERLSIAANRRIRGLGKHQIDALKKEFS